MSTTAVRVLGELSIEVPASIERIYSNFEPTTRDVIVENLKKGHRFLDIGANFGFFSALAASIVGPDGEVISIEAHPGVLPLLGKNLEQFDNVKIVGEAVGAAKGSTEFHLTEDFVNSGVAPNPFGQELQKTTIPIDTVDSVLSRHCGPDTRIDFIKCDVQGDEIAVLEGCRNLIENNDSLAMIVEWAPPWMKNAGYEPSEFPSFIESLGFGEIVIVDDYLQKTMTLEEMESEFERDTSGKRFCNVLARK